MSRLLRLKKEAEYDVDKISEVSTVDHEDHSFFGIMFDIEAKAFLPVQSLLLTSISVRGKMGHTRVWIADESHQHIYHDETKWVQVHQENAEGTWSTNRNPIYTVLKLKKPYRLSPGKRYGVYIHVQSPTDEALIYDDQRNAITHEDDYIRILPGLADLSLQPFSNQGIWGWGWRPNREFVGKVEFGVRFLLFRPVRETYNMFFENFQKGVKTMLLLHQRNECLVYNLSKDIVMFILNMLPWDWWPLTREERTKRVKYTARERRRETENNRIGWMAPENGETEYADRIINHQREYVERNHPNRVVLRQRLWEMEDDSDSDTEFVDEEDLETVSSENTRGSSYLRPAEPVGQNRENQNLQNSNGDAEENAALNGYMG
eukprot:maker-scaffold_2-snap-gene-12.0-mRNA-1 protein AED:0.51 eAED:0.52 QI:0/0/0/0.8/0.75/0.8/5/0/375